MVKRVWILGIFILFSVMFMMNFTSSASNSSSFVEFFIFGCGSVPAESCFEDGTSYCDNSGSVWDTLDTNICISTGCCPEDYICGCSEGEETCPDSERRCIGGETTCNDLDETKCDENEACVWMDETCYDRGDFKSCSNYTEEELCNSDPFDLGKTGFGTSSCRRGNSVSGNMIIVPNSCRCSWGDTEGLCFLNYNTTNQTYSSDPNFFQCSKTFALGACIDGFQNFSWTAEVSDKNYIPTQQQLIDAECVTGTRDVACGKKGVSLPGFSVINFLGIFSLLFIFYFFKMKKSKILIFSLIFGILFFSISFSSAISSFYTCDYSQQIYRLHGTNNSHVQLSGYIPPNVSNESVGTLGQISPETFRPYLSGQIKNYSFCGDVGNVNMTANAICAIKYGQESFVKEKVVGNKPAGSSCIYYNGTSISNIPQVILGKFLNVSSNSKIIINITCEPNPYLYLYSVCFNKIFGYNYTGPEDPHLATCDKPLFWVNKTSNSHASLINDSVYTIPICYEGLQCEVYETNSLRSICPNDGTSLVARLYPRVPEAERNEDTNNSHVSYAPRFLGIHGNDDNSYSSKVCCKPIAQITWVNWTDMDGMPIEKACPGDYVKMVIRGYGLQNLMINYSLFKKIDWFLDPEIVKGRMTLSPLAPSNNTYFALWTPEESHATSQFYFKIKASRANEVQSSLLEIMSPTSSFCTHRAPEINISIVYPKCAGIDVEKDSVQSVQVQIENKYELVKGNLSIGNDSFVELSNLYFTGASEGFFNVTYNFSKAGSTQIKLDVNYFQGGVSKRKREISNIIVYDPTKVEKYVAACIKHPEDLSNINESIVLFDATNTRAIKYDPNANPKKSVLSLQNVRFSWRFNEGSPFISVGTPIGSGDYFYRVFSRTGLNFGVLNCSIN